MCVRGEGFSDIFIHTTARIILGGSNLEFQFFFFCGGGGGGGEGQKNEYFFWGYEDFVDIFGGHHKNGLYLGVIFLRSRYRMGDIFGVAKISKIFWGAYFFISFVGVNGRCWARAYV